VSLQKHLGKYYPNVDPQLVSFLGKIFVYDPTKRITAEQALQDPYLAVEETHMDKKI
jgi:serine/threonine protein kinase